MIVAVSFSLDNPGFSASAEISQGAPSTSPPPSLSTGSSSSSAPSSACCNCPKCRSRMSKPVRDSHTVCVICRGVDCSLDSHCDECLEWAMEKMEAYIKHRLVLLCKERRRKDSLPKPPSSPVPSPSPSTAASFPVPIIDDRFDAKLAELSSSFEQKLDSLSSLLSKFASLQAPSERSMSARMPSNEFLSAPQAVPVLSPSPGLDMPSLNPGPTVGYHRGLLADGVGQVLPDGRVPTHLVQDNVGVAGATASAAGCGGGSSAS